MRAYDLLCSKPMPVHYSYGRVTGTPNELDHPLPESPIGGIKGSGTMGDTIVVLLRTEEFVITK